MSNTRQIIHAQLSDLPMIMQCCNHSRTIMRANGNMTQWVNGYPSAEVIQQDIENHCGYLIVENDEPIGYFAFILGADPTYAHIEKGRWIDDETPYGTIHRLACLPGHHGIARDCFDWCGLQAECLRADTHADNAIMQHTLTQLGFCYCGIIHVADGTPRQAYQKMMYHTIDNSLREYISHAILPRYSQFDSAHQLDHVLTVMAQSMLLSQHYEVRAEMVYAIAAYHDTGLCQGREQHHITSGQIIRSDNELTRWFTPQEIEIMAQAAEDHRASSKTEPRSLYGRIVAEADRDIDPLTIVRRTLQYGLSLFPELSRQQHFDRALEHLTEKYSPTGYLKLFIPESRNAAQIKDLHQLIANTDKLRGVFESVFNELQQ